MTIIIGMNNIAELNRRLDNLFRFATVAEVSYDPLRCKMKSGNLLTAWLPCFTLRAGDSVTWDPPTIGEQGLIFSPSGDPAQGVALVGLYCDQFPAPSTSPTLHCRRYRDGAVIDYDFATHSLSATLPAGGTVTLLADGGVNITGDVTVNGDVIARGISLINHVHGGVQVGGSSTGKPK